MQLSFTEYELKKIPQTGRGRHLPDGHTFLSGTFEKEGEKNKVLVYFESITEEKKLFNNCELLLEGDFIEGDTTTPPCMVLTRVLSARLNEDLPLADLSIHDRLMATGLIHEFKQCFRRDKIRAREILKILGVSENYAEEILLRNSYILPFV